MSVDEGLVDRVRTLTRDVPAITERKMFGGLCFMSHGNMCFGILGSEIMVRVGPAAYAEVLAGPHARAMDFTGKPLRGMVEVDPEGISEDGDLAAWLRRGLAFAELLPPKHL